MLQGPHQLTSSNIYSLLKLYFWYYCSVNLREDQPKQFRASTKYKYAKFLSYFFMDKALSHREHNKY